MVAQFNESGMDNNTIEDWLILLFLSSTTDQKLLNDIFKKIKDIESATNLINLS